MDTPLILLLCAIVLVLFIIWRTGAYSYDVSQTESPPALMNHSLPMSPTQNPNINLNDVIIDGAHYNTIGHMADYTNYERSAPLSISQNSSIGAN